jgi:hypothetical protein
MTFDFALWGEGKVPVTLVCEEAHRYVPAVASSGFEPCKRAIAKIAKEGRKYGASLCIVTQRPAEIDPTILSQCNTVFALRMSNDKDQQIVSSAVSDTGSGLLEFLPALGQREAIAFGDGVALPVRIKFDELPKSALPRSSTARFTERWQKSVNDEGYLDQVVERWRNAGISSGQDPVNQMGAFADAMGISGEPEPVELEPAVAPVETRAPLRSRETSDLGGARAATTTAAAAMTARRSSEGLRREPTAPAALRQSAQAPSQARREPEPAAAGQQPASANSGAFRSLRDRLMQRPQGR